MTMRRWSVLVALAAVGLAGCASDDWEGKYNEEQKRNLDLAAENDELKQQRAELASKVEQSSQALRQSDAEAQKARQAAESAARAAEEARRVPKSGSSADDSAALNDFARQMEREGPNGTKVEVTKDGNIEITLPSDVTFAAGSPELSESGKKSLRAIAPLLKNRYAPYKIRVEGHTDATPLAKTKGKFQDNFGLGSARSLSVVRFMESELAIEPMRLMSASCGQHEPVADNQSEKGKKLNRRVEIVVVIPHEAAMSLAK